MPSHYALCGYEEEGLCSWPSELSAAGSRAVRTELDAVGGETEVSRSFSQCTELRISLAEEGADGRGESPCRALIPGSDGRVGFISLQTRKWGRALMFTEHLPMPDTVLGNLYVI